MSEYTATFDGHDLSELFTIAPPVRKLVTWEPTLLDGASIGALFAGTKTQAMEVTLTLTTFADTLEERLDAFDTLALWLAVDEPKVLTLSDEVKTVSGSTYTLHRLALPTGTPQIDHAFNADTASVTFICPSPLKSGLFRTKMFLPSGELAHQIYGNAPTYPSIAFSGVSGDSDGKFAIDLNYTYAPVQHIVLDVGTSGTVNVQLNCATRTYYVNGVRKMLPLETLWPVFYGGQYVIFAVQSGGFTSCTFEYTDMWW